MSELPIEVDVHTVKLLIDGDEEFFLLDCREHHEYEFARIDGAQLIPMGEITQRVDELQEHVEKRIVVMCHHGGRSYRVTHWLRQNGFPHTQNMAGGIEAWSVEVDPDVPRY